MKGLVNDYLESLTVDQRRANGQIYTPNHLVDFVLEQSGYTSSHPIQFGALLDPACGRPR
jgi:hypothetical protein